MSEIENYSKVLIAGKGTVGTALGNLIEKTNLYTVQYEDPFKNLFVPENYMPDIIHITFPLYERDQFLTDLQRIIQRFVVRFEDQAIDYYNQKVLIIVDSTIILGVLPALQKHYEQYCDFVYSPVRASETLMEEELLKYFRYFAPVSKENTEIGQVIEEYYTSLGLKYRQFENSEALVLGKLSAVSWYTTNIAYVQQLSQVCKQHNLDFDEVYTKFNEDETIGHKYNPETKSADYIMPRPIFYPGIINGKCCIPDIVLMMANQYGDTNFWRWVYHTNEKHKAMLQTGKTIIENNPTVEPGTNISKV